MAATALRLCRAARLLPAAAATAPSTAPSTAPAPNTAPAPRLPPRLAFSSSSSASSVSSSSSASRRSPPQPVMPAFQYPEVYRDETAVSTALAGTAPGVRRPPGPAAGNPARCPPRGRLGAGVPPRLSGLCSAAAAERPACSVRRASGLSRPRAAAAAGGLLGRDSGPCAGASGHVPRVWSRQGREPVWGGRRDRGCGSSSRTADPGASVPVRVSGKPRPPPGLQQRQQRNK